MAAPGFLQGMLFRPLSGLARASAAIGTALSRRRLAAELGALDDHILRDIGVTRHDVICALAEPLFRDPTIQLTRRAAESRTASRVQAYERMQLARLLADADTPARVA